MRLSLGRNTFFYLQAFCLISALCLENRNENGAQGGLQRPRLASVPSSSRAEDAVDQLQENEKLIAGELTFDLTFNFLLNQVGGDQLVFLLSNRKFKIETKLNLLFLLSLIFSPFI